VPPKVEYSLTTFVKTLIPIVLSLEAFGLKNKNNILKFMNNTE